MTLPSFNKFSMFELKIYFLKTVDRSVGSMKGRAVNRTGRYVSCIVRQLDVLVSGDYAEDPLPLGKGHPESQADTDSFQKPVKFVIPDPNYYGTDPESKITKNV